MREEKGGSWGETKAGGGRMKGGEGERREQGFCAFQQSWPSSSTPEKLYEIIQLLGNVKSD